MEELTREEGRGLREEEKIHKSARNAETPSPGDFLINVQ
jgi:hypothetical protein